MADNDETTRGPVPPYGPAIWDAAKRGDLEEMEHIADAARQAIARGGKQEGVQFQQSASASAAHFRDIGENEVVDIRSALNDLEKKIAHVRSQQNAPKPPPGDPPTQS